MDAFAKTFGLIFAVGITISVLLGLCGLIWGTGGDVTAIIALYISFFSFILGIGGGIIAAWAKNSDEKYKIKK